MKIWVENRLQETKREIEELEGRAGVLMQIDNAVDNMFCKSTEDFARAHRDEERPDGSTLH